MPGMSPAERIHRARLAAHTKWAKHDPVSGTAAARAAAFDRFLSQVDAIAPGLPPDERHRRAECLQKAHLAAIALKAAKTKRLNAERRAAQNGGAA